MFGFFRRKSEPAPKTRDDIERDASENADVKTEFLLGEYRMRINDIYQAGATKLRDPALSSEEKVRIRREIMAEMKKLNEEFWRAADEIHEEYLDRVSNL